MAAKAKELAEILGISPASVSLALNHKPGISAEMRKRILDAAGEYGFEELIQSQEDSQKNILFLVYRKNGIGEDQSPYFTQIFSEVIEGVEYQAKISGYGLVIQYIDQYSIEEEVAQIDPKKIEGILLLATEMEENQISLFSEAGVKTVIVDNYSETEEMDCVTINNEQGVEIAISYLEEMGHREIGYLHISDNAHNFSERYFGYKKSMEKHGLSIHEDSIIDLSTHGGEEVYYSLKKTLESRKVLPTAFFADNDIIAIQAMRVLKEMGYKIPKDISLVGFDNIPTSQLVEPPLTSVATSKHAIGSTAVNVLVGRMHDKVEGVKKVEMKSHLIRRKSVSRYKTD